MDLTVKYNHSAIQCNAEQLGTTKKRWDEILKLRREAEKRPGLVYNSQGIEWVLSQLKDVEPCDLIIVGYMFG